MSRYTYLDQPLPDIDKFFGLIDYTDSCWIWMGSYFQNGYGKYGFQGAHRLSYKLCIGDIPDWLQLDHLCRNRGCVNPRHLEAVTLVENVLRGESIFAKNKRKTHCKSGHEFTMENTYIRKDRPSTRNCRICRDIAVKRSLIKKERIIS